MIWLQRWWRAWNTDWQKTSDSDWSSALAALASAVLLWPLTNQLPMLGFDWRIYFWAGDFRQYPPWTKWVLWPLLALPWRAGLAGLNALLLMTVAISVAREVYRQPGRSLSLALTGEALGAALLALFTPPVMVLLWVGNIEAVALWGLLIMPAGLVLVFLKPHLGVWAVLSQRSSLVWAVFFGLLSLLVWPGWPFRVLGSVGERVQHPSAFGWISLGWPLIVIGLALLTRTPADPLPLMAAGAFLSPFLMPQHFVFLLPALGRTRGWRRLALWAGAWLLAMPLMFGGWPKYLGLGFPLLVWWFTRKTGEA